MHKHTIRDRRIIPTSVMELGRQDSHNNTHQDNQPLHSQTPSQVYLLKKLLNHLRLTLNNFSKQLQQASRIWRTK